MEKQLSIFKGLIFAVLVGGALASCVQGELTLSFQSLTQGTIQFNYLVDPLVQGAFLRAQSPGKNPVNLPITLEEWNTAVARVAEGAALVSFSSNLTPRGWECQLQLRFTSLRGLEGLFVAVGQNATLLLNSGVYTLNHRWNLPPTLVLTSKTRNILRTLYENYQIVIRVASPRAITSFSSGVLSADRRQWSLTQSVTGLIDNTTPLDFRLQW